MNDRQLSEDVYWMLLQLGCRSRQGMAKLAEKHDLSPMQMHTLWNMQPNEPVPMNSISSMLSCDASNVTGIIDRLLSRGLIVREEKPEDRRVKMITLTLKGQKVRRETFGDLYEHELPEFKRLSIEQQTQLGTYLKLVLQPR